MGSFPGKLQTWGESNDRLEAPRTTRSATPGGLLKVGSAFPTRTTMATAHGVSKN